VLLRQDAGAASVDEQRGVEGGQEADGGGRLGVRQRRAGKVEQLLAALSAEGAQLEARQRGRDSPDRDSRPAGDVGRRARSEALEVAAHYVLHGGLDGDRGRPEPVLGGGE
jgi:hypothetical protein